MSGPMYFNPTPEQVAASLASNCGMATPKDPSPCNRRCGLYDTANNKPCGHYRVVTVQAREGAKADGGAA